MSGLLSGRERGGGERGEEEEMIVLRMGRELQRWRGVDPMWEKESQFPKEKEKGKKKRERKKERKEKKRKEKKRKEKRKEKRKTIIIRNIKRSTIFNQKLDQFNFSSFHSQM